MKVKLVLEHPPRLADGVLEVLELRRPTVADVLAIEQLGDRPDFEKDVALVSRLAGRPREDIEALDVADFGAVQEALQGFFSPRSS